MSTILNEKTGFTGRIFGWGLTICIALGLITGAFFVTATDAYAGSASCGKDRYCGIQGTSFESIYYSSRHSGLAVLYDKGKVGDIRVWVSEKQYRKGTGTVQDAVNYLASGQEYAGFKVVKATKSTGLFKSEAADGIYVVVPKHAATSTTRAPEFRFFEKGGQVTLYIKDFDMNDDDSGM